MFAPEVARAAECPSSPFSASGYFFQNYESVEHSPDGYLIYRFKINVTDGRPFLLKWSYFDDECNSSSVTGEQRSVSLPIGVSEWSVRFSSPTHFDIWNDQNETVVIGFDIIAYPPYTSIVFSGSIDGGASKFNARKLKIDENGEAPSFPGTLPLPEACPPSVVGSIAGSNPYFFDSYERAEYVDGLLRIHLRLKTPHNDGRAFRSGISVGDADCVLAPEVLGPLGTSITPRIRYFSFRMNTPTHWQLWNDETNTPLTCATCEGDIGPDTPFVRWFASIDGSASSVRTTPFPPVKPEPQYEECCSSIVFLPGIKGSVLKNGANTVWPPTILSSDVPQLALTLEGESVNPIVVDGVLEFFYTTPIYKGFTSFLDTLVADETIKDWMPVPYDWRFSPEKILEDGVITPSGTFDILTEIENLAAQSDTGQITIVAHSMGGLMGKAIIKALEEEGKASIIDSFVMVGTPQLGTPQAVASLLHGDDESIAGGLIVNPALVRQVAQNMPSSYNLLPSPRYLQQVADPVIVFDDNADFTQAFRDAWDTTTDTYSEFFAFLTGGTVARFDPLPNELRTPEILNPDLLTNAANFHNEYDSYDFPDSIRVVQVAGWGIPTTKGIKYKNNHFLPSYGIIPTVEGDKTVVYPSAVSSVGEIYFFDLAVFNAQEDIPDFQHRDLLSASPVQAALVKILKEENVELTTFIKNVKPDPGSLGEDLIISTHSPVILGAYDSFGNFTGVDQDQDLSAEFLSVSENIPGSTFLYTAESQYIFLPKNGIYTFVYKGIGTGPTTVEMEDFSNDITTPVASYPDIPTTPTTEATLVVDTSAPQNAHIEIDTNNDEIPDTYVAPDGGTLTLAELLVNLRTYIQGMEIDEKLKKNLLKKLDKIEKKLAKQKNKSASKAVMNLEKKVSKKGEKGKISDADVEEVLSLLEQIENAI